MNLSYSDPYGLDKFIAVIDSASQAISAFFINPIKFKI